MGAFTSTTEFSHRGHLEGSGRLSMRRVSPWIAAWVLAGAGCSARAAPAPAVVDCVAADRPYDFWVVENYDDGNFGWYGYGDSTPGASWLGEGTTTNSPPAQPIENGGPCGPGLPSAPSGSALLLEAHGYQDYGNGWGSYNLGVSYNGTPGPQQLNSDGGSCPYAVCPIDASAYAGVTFWARSYDPSGLPTTKGFTFEINDKKSYGGSPQSTADASTDSCVNYDAGFLPNGTATYSASTSGGTGPAGGGTTSAEPPANACGNSFNYELLTTDQWQLYTLPWSVFNQLPKPNRIATGFDPSSFYQILVVAPKEARSELWIDSVGFYRAKQPEAGL